LRDETDQAIYVADTVLENREAGIPLKAQAILFRASHHSGSLEVELTRRNIPFVKTGGLKFLEAAHIKDVMAFLRWAQNPRGRVAGFRTIQLLPGVGPKTAARLLDYIAGGDAIQAITDFAPPPVGIDHWSEFAETVRLLHGRSIGWPEALELVCRWYAPHLERIYDDAMMRQADPVQLAPSAGFCYSAVSDDKDRNTGDRDARRGGTYRNHASEAFRSEKANRAYGSARTRGAIGIAADMIKGASGTAADTPAPEHPSAASGITSDGNTAPVESKPAVGLPRPVSVFVSRKQGRVFVRQGSKALFDLPIRIDEPDRPIGTHLFTAMGFKDDGKTMRWTVVSVPSQYRHHVSRSGKGHAGGQTMDPEQVVAVPLTAAEALERIELPPEAIDQISPLLIAGSSLIVSDNALSDETDADTDFIVLTP